jgi:hypothetical protein
MYQRLILSVICGISSLIGILIAYGTSQAPRPALQECSDKQGLSIVGSLQMLCWDEGRKSLIRFASNQNEANILHFDNPSGKVLDFVFQSDGNSTLQIMDPSGKEIWTGYLAPTTKESLAPSQVQIELPAGLTSFQVKKLNAGEAAMFDLRMLNRSVDTLSVKVQHQSRGHMPWMLLGIVILTLASVISALPSTGASWIGLLTFAYTLLYFFEGLPFYTSLGIFDPFDDKSYVEWAHHIGYQLTLNISDGTSAAADGNIHSWGTGFLLAPPFFLARLLMPLSNGLEPTVFSLVTCWSVVLGLITVILYYKAFSLVFSQGISAFIALLTIAGTSLSKWTFGRLIFSHAPEAFSLAFGTFFFISIYYKNKTTILNYLGLALALWLTIQIRRENVLLILPPLTYELLKLKSRKTQLLPIGILLATFAASLASLQLSNIFTRLKYISASIPTAGIISLDWVRFKTNFLPVLFSSSAGFFTVGVFVPISCFSLLFFRKKIHLVLPFVVVIGGYLLMCMLHQYPTGFEWQNRFLLKINPIIFGGIGIVIQKSKAILRTLLFVILAFGVYYQHILYLENLHPHQAVYADLFTTLTATNPFAFHPEIRFLWPLNILVVIFVFSLIGTIFLFASRLPRVKITSSPARSSYNNIDLISAERD